MALNTPRPLDPARLSAEELRFLIKAPYYNNLISDFNELGPRVYLNTPRQQTTVEHPRTGFGVLDRLPVELQFQIFDVTSINALFSLSRTNPHVKNLVEQWEPFRIVVTEGSDAVRAILATAAGLLWTTEQLVDVLFTSDCEFCGEHGELLHLLKLKRCCFRCLSQERELLAISEKYATNVLNLSHNDLVRLPHLRTMPQKSFWGFPVQRIRWIFDYNAALNVVRQRPRQQGPRPLALSMIGPMKLQPTGNRLKSTERSLQPRSKLTLQARRHQVPLHLLSEEVSPLETMYAQHACAIRLPAKSRQMNRIATGGLKTEISTITAVHCAGCTFYWNYHSPLPWQFHSLYTHRAGDVHTAFTRHLQHCVYAKLQWAWIHNPWRTPNPEDLIIRFLGNMIQKRSGWAPGPKENALFEHIPTQMIAFLQTTGWDANTFQPRHTWPQLENSNDDSTSNSREAYAAEELLERIRARESGSPVDKADHYWDCLVSQEAISQANWACANMANGRVCLFGGPVAVMRDKHLRSESKGFRLPALGLSEMYL